MSDSLAGLAINVNVKQVNDAIKALDGLARKAGEVEKKVSNVNVGTNRGANDRVVQEGLRAAREIEKINRQQNAARKISAEQTISIERAKMNTLIADNNRFFSAMNLAESRRLFSWQKFQDKVNAGIEKEIENNRKRTVAIATEGQRQIAATEAVTRRAESARERAARQIQRETDREIRNAQAQARQTLAQEVALERALQSSRSRLTGITGRANRQLPSVEAASVIRNATDAQRVYEQVLRSSGVTSLAAVRAQGDFSRAMQNASGEIARQGGLLRTLNTNASAMNAAFGGASNTLGGFGRVIFQTNAALASLAGAFALREITQSIMEFERFSNTLRTVSGSSGEFGQNMTFLFNEANRIGFSIGEVGNSFARFSLAMQGAGFNTEQTRSSFSQLAEASRNLGLSSADTTGVIRALEQSMSKGKFMAEEVRLQLGDRLPFAMAALTRAVTAVDGKVSDINKRFEEGTLDVARYGQEFIRQLNLMSGGADALSRTSNTIAAAFGRLGTEFTKTTTYFGEAGFSNAVIIFANNLQRVLELARESGALDILAQGLLKVAQNMEVLAVALGTVATLLSARLIQVLFTSIAQINPMVRGLTLAIGGLTGAYQILSGLNNNAATSAQNFAASLSNLNTITGRVNESVQNYQNLINRGAPLTDASATAVDQHVAANMRLGDSFEVAARKAGEAYAEINRLATEQARREQEAAERNLRGFLAGQSAFQNFGRASRIREAEIRSGLRLQSGQETTNPGLTVTQDTFVNNAIQDFVNLRKSFEETVTSIRAEFGQNIPASVQRLLEAMSRLEGNRTFIDMRDQVRAANQALVAVEGQLNRMTQSDYVIRLTADTVAIQGFDTPRRNGGPSLTDLENTTSEAIRSAGSPRTRIAAFQSNIMSGPLSSMFPGLETTGGRDADIVKRIAANPNVRRLLPGVATALTDSLATSSSTGARGSVGEAVRDLQLQAGRAGIEGGTADAAYADALRRIRDAATNTRESVSALREEELARQAVAERLNKEMELAIRLMARETTNNIRLANAYMQSGEAGRQMEITIRAEAEARKYARETGVEYAEALRIMTARVNDLVNSERQLAMGRQVDQGRKDIEVLELEGRLITANVASRNAEVAVLRARQEFVGQDTSIIEAQIRRTEELRSRNEQLTNSWTEVSRLGEQAFERIGSAITEALAQGRIEGISFKNVMKAVFSEVAQAALKLAVINPILNAAFGGTRGTIGGAFTAAGIGNNVSNAFGGGSALSVTDSSGNVVGQLSNLASGRTVMSGLSGNLGSFFPGGNAVNTGFGFIDGALNTSLISPTIGNISPMVGAPGTFLPAGAQGPLLTAPVEAANIGGLTAAQALGPALSIAGGAYGVYSGLQRGGVGGYTSALGGAVSAGTGLAMLGSAAGLLPALGVLGPAGLAVGALLAIGGSLLPGAKPSSMGQEARIELATGDISRRGLTGDRYSRANATQAEDAVQNIATLAGNLSAALGGLSLGNQAAAVGVTRNTLYLDAVGQKAQFSNSEEGAKELARVAGQFLIDAFTDVEKRNIAAQGVAGSDRLGILINSNRDVETLSANLQWYDNVFKKLTETAEKTSQFAQSLESTKQPFDEAITKAQQLGVAEGELVRKRDEAVAKLTAERDRQVLGIREGLSLRGINSGATEGDRGNLLYWANLRENARLAVNEIEELRNTLESLGISASEVNVEISRLAEIQAAEASRRQEERAFGVLSFDQNLNLRRFRASGDTNLADWYESEISKAQEIREARTALENLGLDAASVAARIVDLERTIAMEREALLQQTLREQAQQVENARNSAASSIGGLREYARTLAFSDASTLDPRAQYQLALSQFDTASSGALRGDARSISSLQGFSERVLSAGRQMFGSGAEYARLFERVIGTIEGVASIGEDALTASFMTQLTETSTQTLAQELQAIRGELVALRNQTSQQQSAPARA